MSFFNDNGLLKPFGENEILYSSQWFLLNKMLNTVDADKITLMIKALDSQIHGDELLAVPGEDWSHDNHTGYLCLGRNLGFDLKFNAAYPPDWYKRMHPRDLVFWGYMWNPYIFWILMWIPSIAMIISCLRKYESNGDLATSTKLLAWLRLNTIKMPLTKMICDAIIKKRWGDWSKVFSYYFKNPLHPNNILSKVVYDRTT